MYTGISPTKTTRAHFSIYYKEYCMFWCVRVILNVCYLSETIFVTKCDAIVAAKSPQNAIHQSNRYEERRLWRRSFFLCSIGCYLNTFVLFLSASNDVCNHKQSIVWDKTPAYDFPLLSYACLLICRVCVFLFVFPHTQTSNRNTVSSYAFLICEWSNERYLIVISSTLTILSPLSHFM